MMMFYLNYKWFYLRLKIPLLLYIYNYYKPMNKINKLEYRSEIVSQLDSLNCVQCMLIFCFNWVYIISGTYAPFGLYLGLWTSCLFSSCNVWIKIYFNHFNLILIKIPSQHTYQHAQIFFKFTFSTPYHTLLQHDPLELYIVKIFIWLDFSNNHPTRPLFIPETSFIPNRHSTLTAFTPFIKIHPLE